MHGGRGPRPGRLGALARAIGVTRVARLTGLDRTGVEVASAIRPLGHVLQVTNGKGARFEEAAAGALLEAAELFAAERPACETWGRAGALSRRHGADAVLAPRALADVDDPSLDEVHLAWSSGVELSSGRSVLVPACAVYVPPPGAAPLGPALLRWTSNGMGAAFRREDALLHALLEAVERDHLARALPDGFTERDVAVRLVDPRSLPRAAPSAAALAAALERRGFRVHLLDASASATGLPCAAALVVDHELGAVPVSAGYACRLRRDAALAAALLEAAQSRATEIHGAREDVALGDRHSARDIARLCAQLRPRRDAGRMPDVRAPPRAGAAAAVVRRLRRAGHRRVVAVDLHGPPGIAVVKVLAPGLLLSELL
ncbi:MAG TPA: YcaO-like family protein [Anaeromyxobacter sp.]|nr:YcaO-like family protein [Anaeromyxobacter sp.]